MRTVQPLRCPWKHSLMHDADCVAGFLFAIRNSPVSPWTGAKNVPFAKFLPSIAKKKSICFHEFAHLPILSLQAQRRYLLVSL